MHVLAICPTKGRHTHVEKVVSFFLKQDYIGNHTLLIYNNSSISQQLNDISLPHNKHILLINRDTGLLTGNKYTTLGEIYNDILSIAPQADIVTHFEDDDCYLPNHLSEGVKGIQRGKKNGYKPLTSYFLTAEGVQKASNILEPSIFVTFSHLKKWGYHLTNVDAHHRWISPLTENNDMFVDKDGLSTFMYDWEGTIPTWKTSGDPHNPNNFDNYERFSQDHGDGVITPASDDIINRYYNLIKSKTWE